MPAAWKLGAVALCTLAPILGATQLLPEVTSLAVAADRDEDAANQARSVATFTTTYAATTPIVGEAPKAGPLTVTENGTVVVWPSQMAYVSRGPHSEVATKVIGVGPPVTLKTPFPEVVYVERGGSGQCNTRSWLSKSGLEKACLRAANRFSRHVDYKMYTSRYRRAKQGFVALLTFGRAGCIIKFECKNNDYGIGMNGVDIGNLYHRAKKEGKIGMCGTIGLSNNCTITADYCTSCKDRGHLND